MKVSSGCSRNLNLLRNPQCLIKDFNEIHHVCCSYGFLMLWPSILWLVATKPAKIFLKYFVPSLHWIQIFNLVFTLMELVRKNLYILIKFYQKRNQYMAELVSFAHLAPYWVTWRCVSANLNRIKLSQFSKVIDKESFVVWMSLYEVIGFDSKTL